MAGGRKRIEAMLTALAVLGGLTVIGAPRAQAATAAPAYFQTAPIASWRVDGAGWATLLVGNTVYVGGSFTTATSPTGTSSVARANLAAFDATTGALRGTFRADTNGTVRALATDGTRLYVGGAFTTINGYNRSRLAAVNLSTGVVDTTWAANANATVYSLAVGGGRLYAGGTFTSLKNVARNRIGALSLADSSVAPYAPALDAAVSSIVVDASGNRVYLGGDFTTVNGAAAPWLAKTDASGVLVPVAWQGLLGPALDLELDADGTHLAVAQGGAGNRGTWYEADTGTRLWFQRCDGDGQAIHIVGGTVVTGFHESCEYDTTIRLAANAVSDGARDRDFLPAFDQFWGVRALDGDAAKLIVAGDFTSIAGVAVQGFAIIPSRTVAPSPVSLSSAATWRYQDGGSVPAGWNQPAFDDSTWRSGGAQLGYGDGDEVTEVGYGPSSTAKYLTTWFRTTFQVTELPGTLTLRLLADDGAAVYVNGVEVVRDNLPAGTLLATTRASSSRSGLDETAVRSFAIDPARLVAGQNTIAVEVHQDTAASSDLSFAASLSSTVALPTTTTTTAPTTTTTTAPPNPVLYTETFATGTTAWPSAWTSDGVGGTATVVGGAGSLQVPDTAGAYVRARLDGPAATADTDVTFTYQWASNAPSAYLNVYVRGSGGWANAYRPRTGIGIELLSSSGTVAVRSTVNGVATTLQTQSGAQSVTTQRQHLRIRMVGSTLSYKIWLDGQAEPTAWKGTVTDAPVAGTGRLHLSLVRASANVGAKAVAIDDVVVTDGTTP